MGEIMEYYHYIDTTEGPIMGYTEKNNGSTCYKFKRIPYAVPPVGKLRFLPPQPVKPWKKLLDCTQDTPHCITFNYFKTDVLESEPSPRTADDDRKPEYSNNIDRWRSEMKATEDCLYLEVSTPNLKPDKCMPVMFWIGTHLFAVSLDDLYDPITLVEQGVVFVRCGFRLGPFGFLSFNSFNSPGNCGLKDIVMALKWVQKNIEAFGGDPNNITLFGHSSGGAVVHLMILSSITTGLFHKAIVQSLSSLNRGVTKNPSKVAMEFAKYIGINKSCKEEIIEELRSFSTDEILKAYTSFHFGNKCEVESRDVFKFHFRPCIEEEFEGQTAFLTKSPFTIIKSGKFNKVPLMIGSTSLEGSLVSHFQNDYYDKMYGKFNEDTDLIVPDSLSGENNELAKGLGQQILRFYLNAEASLSERNKTQYLQLLSDYYFLYYLNKTVRLTYEYASELPIYYYIFNYTGDWNFPNELQYYNSTGHSSELPYIFKFKCPNYPSGSRDTVVTRDRVTKLWTNFSKFGNPTPEVDDPLLQIKWDPVESAEKLNYLNIGSELTKGRNPFFERMKFWDELHNENLLLRTLVYFRDLGFK